jgi:hypothetical protein
MYPGNQGLAVPEFSFLPKSLPSGTRQDEDAGQSNAKREQEGFYR